MGKAFGYTLISICGLWSFGSVAFTPIPQTGRTVQGVPLAVVVALAKPSSGFCSCSTTPAIW